jgi:osmotically-inducible protein OsmY
MASKIDVELTRDVLDELLWDPDMGVSDLDIKVDHSNVTLAGTTATYEDKWEAEDAAFWVPGVKSVTNHLVVDPAALGISVSNGTMTLSGDVNWFY